ncbi:MAG: nucleotidyltransferase [Pirellulaceae bacterium]
MAKSNFLNPILVAAVKADEIFNELGWEFCFIGGVALLRWGQPRQTIDVDAVIWASLGAEKSFAKSAGRFFKHRFEGSEKTAVEQRILLLRDEDGIDFDLSLGALDFEQRVIDRASYWKIPKHGKIKTCTAEDLIVLKAIANRDQDWIDIQNVCIRQSKKLNLKQVNAELNELLELVDEPEILGRWQAIRKS